MKTNIRQKFIKFLFYQVLKKTNRKGLAPIYCRITSEGKRAEFSTGIFIQPESFDRGRIDATTKEQQNYQKQLEKIKSALVEIETILKIKGQAISSDKIKQTYLEGFKESRGTFVQVASEWLEKQGKLVDTDFLFEGYQRRKRTVERFIAFLKIRNNSQAYLCDLREALIEDFCLYCYSDLKLSKGYVKREIATIKAIIDYAVVNDYTAKNYITHYRIKGTRHKGEIKSLSIEQIKVLQDTRFSSLALRYTRDCFLFQCFTGLAHTDVSQFSRQHISTDGLGKPWLIIHRQKTNAKSTIPLIPEAQEIIDRYQDLNHRIDSNIKNAGLLPVYCNQVYNRLLKEIGLICNIDTQLMTSHTARKTFAMVVLNSGNVSIETVSKMLGHAKIGVTQQYYAYVDTRKIAHEMQDFKFIN